MSRGVSLPAATRLGVVHLTVADLDRSRAFYEHALGLRVHRCEPGELALGAGGDDLLVLVHEPGTAPSGRHAGLFHFALLFDSREELAHALWRVADAGVRLTGASDHGVSEALYLRDPDGHGIELYADRPRAQWPPPAAGDAVGMFSVALDLEDLATQSRGAGAPRPQVGEGLRMGHVHLQVPDAPAATAFYSERAGFDVMVRMAGAGFLAAGGYHHHLAVNDWAGAGIKRATAGTARLLRFTVVVDDAAAVEAVAARVDGRLEDGAAVVVDPAGIESAFVAA